jgi:transposase
MIDTNFLLPILSSKNRHKKTTDFGHIICPKCKVRTKLYKLNDGRRKCKRCGKKFVIKRKTEAKKTKKIADIIVGFCLDFSAKKTAKIYGYRYNDVIKIYQQIRERISEMSSNEGQLKGIVEADESYFGGINRKRNKKYRKQGVGRGRGTDKSPVFGIRERKGKVYIDVLKDITEEQIESIIENKVRKGSTIMTDEFKSYKGLIYKGYIHRFVEHNKEEYGRGNVHINGMENFWSWAKEQMFKFHGVFRRNLFYYLKEMEWKFNHRELSVEEKAIEIAKIFSLRGW